jgi:hypothetical protein
LPETQAIDIQAKKSALKSRFSQSGDFVGRAAVSSLKIVCRNEEKSLTGKRVFVNMPFCLGREKVVCKATKRVRRATKSDALKLEAIFEN